MTKFVPYIAEEDIKRDSAAMLAEYAQARRVVIVPPIPIEDIDNCIVLPYGSIVAAPRSARPHQHART